MATLPETPEWVAGIYQIETTDPVLGGPPNEGTGAGMTNIPAQQLAKRTAFLKALVDEAGVGQELGTLVTNFDAISKAGFYRGAAGATGAPDAAVPHALLHVPGNASGTAHQIAFRIGSVDRVSYRRKNGGTWLAWVQFATASELGTIASQNANAVVITGGSISGITDLAVADGGTGASNAAGARSNLGLGSVATESIVPIEKGGTGATTAAGALTNLGVTATAAELNVLDGVTATTTEINRVAGVTSSVQTQLDGKVPNGRTVSAGLGLEGGGALSGNISLALALGELAAVDAGSMVNPRFPVIDGVDSGTQGRSTASQMRNALAVYSKSEVDALVTPAAIRALIAQTTLGSVGSYAFLRRSAQDTAITKGASIAGSALRYAGVIDSESDYKAELELADNTAPSGTWLSLGSVGNRSTQYSATLFLRIA